ILPVIGAKRSRVLPLRVGDLVALANRDPATFANRHPRTLIRFIEPRNHPGGFRPMTGRGFVVVGKGAVKWILAGREFYRRVIAAMRWIRVVETAVTLRPLLIPRTLSVWHRNVFGRLLANPGNRRHDALLPRKTFTRRCREHERIDPDDRLLRFSRSFLRLLTKFCFARLGFSHCSMSEQR